MLSALRRCVSEEAQELRAKVGGKDRLLIH
jgi:hypothetical protein